MLWTNGGKTFLREWWSVPCQMEEYVKHSWNLRWVSFCLMAFITNGRQLRQWSRESPYCNDSKPEREGKHFRNELWSPNDLGDLTMWSGGSRMLFSRGKAEEEHSTRSNQLQDQGVQNWVGSSVLRDSYFMLCMASGQLSSEGVRSLTQWLLVHIVAALGCILRST